MQVHELIAPFLVAKYERQLRAQVKAGTRSTWNER